MAYFDYRQFEEDAKHLQARVTELTAKEDRSADERDEIVSLMGQIHALEAAAGQVKDAELVELRAAAARGNALTPEVPGPTAAEATWAEYKTYLRSGFVGPIMNASLSTTDANGGFIVPEPEHAELIEKIRKRDVVFGNATVFNLTGDTTLLLPYKSAHGVVTTAAEAGARSEQNAPTFTSPSLVCYDYYSDQRATQTFLDNVSGAESMLMGWMYEDIMEQAGADAVSGDGSVKIEGLFNGTSKYTTQFSGSAATILNTSPIKLYFGLPVQYRQSARFIMTSATLAVCVGFALPSNANVPLATVDGNGVWSMYGKPVLESDSAPALGAGLYAMGFGDIRQGYAVGIHRSTTILRDPFTAVPKVRFYSLARLGGTPWNYQAIQIMRCATV
jgi:HK97 family phage major capsid protein